MSNCLFIHNFFQDGRLDVIEEVREMQLLGQWTRTLRADWTKQAIACYQRTKHTHPHLPQGQSYYAGRIAGLKSAITANYPPFDPACHGKMVFLSTPSVRSLICLECGDNASWKCCRSGFLEVALCGRCKQEWVRLHCSTTTSGYDHQTRALLPVPQDRWLRFVYTPDLDTALVVFPLTALLTYSIYNLYWQISHLIPGIVWIVRWFG